MATAREHLRDLHERAAQHHTIKSAHHKAMAAHYENLSAHLGKSEASKDATTILAAMSDSHKEMSTEHADMARHHTAAMEACSKAIDAAGLTKRENELRPLPEGFSRVTPTAPGLTAVPRTGGAPLQRPSVPQEFEKVFSVEEPE